jgi:hypothetical protein
MPLSEAELDEALKKTVDTSKLSDEEKARLRGDEHAEDDTPDDDEGNRAADAAEKNKGKEGKEGKEGDEGKQRKPNLVPQERVNEIVARSRQRAEGLEARVAELEAELRKGEELDFDEVEKELDKLEKNYLSLAKTEGKEEEAAALRRQIRTMERRVNNMQAVYFARGQSDEAINRMRTDEVIDALEGQYAFLDPNDKENYDPDIVAEILDYQKGFVAAGIVPHEAMVKAANYVLSQLDLVPVDEEGEEGEEGGEPEGLRGKRELAARQPPSLTKVGKGGVPKTTGAEELAQAGQQRFSKLRPKMDEDTLAKARGDFI